MPPPLTEQVEEQILKVKEAFAEATDELDGVLGFGANDEALARLTRLEPLVDRWAATGMDAAEANTRPGKTTWGRWTKSGEDIAKSVLDIAEISKSVNLDAVVATAMDLPKQVPENLEAAVQVAEKAATRATKAVAKAALPLTPLAIGVAVLFFLFRK